MAGENVRIGIELEAVDTGALEVITRTQQAVEQANQRTAQSAQMAAQQVQATSAAANIASRAATMLTSQMVGLAAGYMSLRTVTQWVNEAIAEDTAYNRAYSMLEMLGIYTQETANEIKAFGEQLRDSAYVAESVSIPALTHFLQVTKNIQLSEYLTELATRFAIAAHTDESRVIEGITRALSGQDRQLRAVLASLGINIKIIKETNDLYELMRQYVNATTDAYETAEMQSKKISETWRELGEIIGRELVPFLQAGAKALYTAFDTILMAIGTVVDVAGESLINFGKLAMSVFNPGNWFKPGAMKAVMQEFKQQQDELLRGVGDAWGEWHKKQQVLWSGTRFEGMKSLTDKEKALLESIQSEEEGAEKGQAEKLLDIRREMMDERMRMEKSELEYVIWAAQQEYDERCRILDELGGAEADYAQVRIVMEGKIWEARLDVWNKQTEKMTELRDWISQLTEDETEIKLRALERERSEKLGWINEQLQSFENLKAAGAILYDDDLTRIQELTNMKIEIEEAYTQRHNELLREQGDAASQYLKRFAKEHDEVYRKMLATSSRVFSAITDTIEDYFFAFAQGQEMQTNIVEESWHQMVLLLLNAVKEELAAMAARYAIEGAALLVGAAIDPLLLPMALGRLAVAAALAAGAGASAAMGGYARGSWTPARTELGGSTPAVGGREIRPEYSGGGREAGTTSITNSTLNIYDYRSLHIYGNVIGMDDIQALFDRFARDRGYIMGADLRGG